MAIKDLLFVIKKTKKNHKSFLNSYLFPYLLVLVLRFIEEFESDSIHLCIILYTDTYYIINEIFFLIAENIRTKITSNYKNILNEMQMRFANETLSKCIGDVELVREKIQPRNGNRRQRMNYFLQFILQHDQNVIEFEGMLRNNGLKELLILDENTVLQNATREIGK